MTGSAPTTLVSLAAGLVLRLVETRARHARLAAGDPGAPVSGMSRAKVGGPAAWHAADRPRPD